MLMVIVCVWPGFLGIHLERSRQNDGIYLEFDTQVFSRDLRNQVEVIT